MPEPLTAERAREIAAALCEAEYHHHEPPCSSCAGIALALIDRDIETLEACAKERCECCNRGIWHPELVCHAQYEQRTLALLRAERERLSSPEPSPKPRDNS